MFWEGSFCCGIKNLIGFMRVVLLPYILMVWSRLLILFYQWLYWVTEAVIFALKIIFGKFPSSTLLYISTLLHFISSGFDRFEEKLSHLIFVSRLGNHNLLSNISSFQNMHLIFPEARIISCILLNCLFLLVRKKYVLILIKESIYKGPSFTGNLSE